MHILIGLITAVGGMLWALYRLQQAGVNLNDLNPFHWFRRRGWQQRIKAKPLHCLDSPMEAAACLLVGMAKLEGEVSREQKQDIIALFESEFNIDAKAAQDLFAGASYMLNDVLDITEEVNKMLAPCKERFNHETTQSLLQMLHSVAGLDHAISDDQRLLIETVDQALARADDKVSRWQ